MKLSRPATASHLAMGTPLNPGRKFGEGRAGATLNRNRNTMTTDEPNPYAERMHRTFDFESHPGIAVVRPEVAKRISEGLEMQRAQQIADMATPPEDDWTA